MNGMVINLNGLSVLVGAVGQICILFPLYTLFQIFNLWSTRSEALRLVCKHHYVLPCISGLEQLSNTFRSAVHFLLNS